MQKNIHKYYLKTQFGVAVSIETIERCPSCVVMLQFHKHRSHQYPYGFLRIYRDIAHCPFQIMILWLQSHMVFSQWHLNWPKLTGSLEQQWLSSDPSQSRFQNTQMYITFHNACRFVEMLTISQIQCVTTINGSEVFNGDCNYLNNRRGVSLYSETMLDVFFVILNDIIHRWVGNNRDFEIPGVFP